MDRMLRPRHSVQPPPTIDASDGGLGNHGNDGDEELTQDQRNSPVLFSTPHTSIPPILDNATTSSNTPTTCNPTPVVATNLTVTTTTEPTSTSDSIIPSVTSLPTSYSAVSCKRQKGQPLTK